jgi:hypothetical protein
MQTSYAASGLNQSALIQALNTQERSLVAFFQKESDEVLDSTVGPYPQKYTALPAEMLATTQDVSGAKKFLVVFCAAKQVKVSINTTNQDDLEQGHLIMTGLHAYMNYADYAYCSFEELSETEGHVYAGFVYLFNDGTLLISSPTTVQKEDLPLGYHIQNGANPSCLIL